jgi:hypothetical protein
LLLIAACIGIVVAVAVSLGPKVLRQARLLHLQHAAMRFRATGVVWMERPGLSPGVMAIEQTQENEDPALASYLTEINISPNRLFIFWCELMNPSGEKRLVMINHGGVVRANLPAKHTLHFRSEIINPAGMWSLPYWYRSEMAPPVPVATFAETCLIHAGQPDPRDPITLHYRRRC